MYRVTGTYATGEVGVRLNGRPIFQTKNAGTDVNDSRVIVTDARLYRLVGFSKYEKDSTVELQVHEGIQLNTLTFGG